MASQRCRVRRSTLLKSDAVGIAISLDEPDTAWNSAGKKEILRILFIQLTISLDKPDTAWNSAGKT